MYMSSLNNYVYLIMQCTKYHFYNNYYRDIKSLLYLYVMSDQAPEEALHTALYTYGKKVSMLPCFWLSFSKRIY